MVDNAHLSKKYGRNSTHCQEAHIRSHYTVYTVPLNRNDAKETQR